MRYVWRSDWHGYSATSSTAIDSNNLRPTAAATSTSGACDSYVDYELPFGKGKKFMTTNNRVIQTLFGGWQLQGFQQQSVGRTVLDFKRCEDFQYGANSRVALTRE